MHGSLENLQGLQFPHSLAPLFSTVMGEKRNSYCPVGISIAETCGFCFLTFPATQCAPALCLCPSRQWERGGCSSVSLIPPINVPCSSPPRPLLYSHKFPRFGGLFKAFDSALSNGYNGPLVSCCQLSAELERYISYAIASHIFSPSQQNRDLP